jgi:hypothetical protein
MKIESTFIDKNNIRRFYKKDGKAGERAYEIICSECGGLGFSRKQSLSRPTNQCSKDCQRAFMFKEKDGRLNWKGGKHNSGSYNKTMAKEHPRADRYGYVPEHILVVEKNIGRYINDGEIIHHIDLDKKNNDISNLYITNRSEHLKIHHQLELLAVEMMKAGLIKFNNGKYESINAE